MSTTKTSRKTVRRKLAALKLSRPQCVELLRALQLAMDHLTTTAKAEERSAVAMECADYVAAKERVMVAMRTAGMLDSRDAAIAADPPREREEVES